MAMADFLSANEVAEKGRASLDCSGPDSTTNCAFPLRRRSQSAHFCLFVLVVSGRCLRHRRIFGHFSRRSPAPIKKADVDHDASSPGNRARELFHRCFRSWIVLAYTGMASFVPV